MGKTSIIWFSLGPQYHDLDIKSVTGMGLSELPASHILSLLELYF